MVLNISTRTTQVHCLSEGRVLLMKRVKPPNLGCWVAPGGKLNSGELPWECAHRELREETGLVAITLHMSGLVTLIIPQLRQPAFLFLFTVSEFTGALTPAPPEGELRWWPFASALELELPQANAVYLPQILSLRGDFYQAKFIYDEDIKLVSVVEHP